MLGAVLVDLSICCGLSKRGAITTWGSSVCVPWSVLLSLMSQAYIGRLLMRVTEHMTAHVMTDEEGAEGSVNCMTQQTSDARTGILQLIGLART